MKEYSLSQAVFISVAKLKNFPEGEEEPIIDMLIRLKELLYQASKIDRLEL
jgi:hypothetical protein